MQEVASSSRPPVIHMGQTVSPLPKLLALLKRGDIVTHMFAPPPNSIIDDSGHILPEVMAARRRGVRFDLGNGRTGHLRWDMAGTRAAGVPARHLLDRLDSRRPHRPGNRLSERYVEVPDAGHVAGPGGGMRDGQCIPHISGLRKPHAANGRWPTSHCLNCRELLEWIWPGNKRTGTETFPSATSSAVPVAPRWHSTTELAGPLLMAAVDEVRPRIDGSRLRPPSSLRTIRPRATCFRATVLLGAAPAT